MLPVIILAGGLATRMRPITETIPKAMIDINGKPFIHYQMEMLKKNNIKHVVLSLGYLGDQVRSYVGNGTQYGINVEYSFDGDKLLGTGGAIKHIGDTLPKEFFVLYGDSYLEADYAAIENVYHKSGKNGLMTVFKNTDKWDKSNVIFKNNTLVKYDKKNRTAEMNYIDWGLGILKCSAFDGYTKDSVFDLSEIYRNLSESGQLAGFEVQNRFYEIGSKEGLEDLRNKLGAS